MGEPLKVDHVRAGFGKVADGLGKAAENVGRLARSTSAQVVEQAGDLKGAAEDSIEKLTTKKPDPYEEAIAEYNGAFTAMNDSGLSLLRQRERSTDLIDLVEFLVNSIANTPKSFGKDFEEIDVHKAQFVEVLEFARRRRAKLTYLRDRPDKESTFSKNYKSAASKSAKGNKPLLTRPA